MSLRILNVNDIERPRMALPVNNSTNTSQVTTSSDHTQIARVKFDEVKNFGGGNFKLNGVVNFDVRIRIPDGPAVVGHQEWNALRSSLDFLYFA